MAKTDIGRLGEALARDPGLKAKLEQAKTLDEMIAIARAAGYSFTAEELKEEALAHKKELTDAELERVAGGLNFTLPIGNVLLLPAVQYKILIGL
jgi:predicted ribosomally synthesized peptide with nif11-like leader